MANAPDDSTPLPQQDRINPVVFSGSAIAIVAFALWTMIFTDPASAATNAVLRWISNTFGRFYFVAVVAYLIFVIAIGLSRFGKLRLGLVDRLGLLRGAVPGPHLAGPHHPSIRRRHAAPAAGLHDGVDVNHAGPDN